MAKIRGQLIEKFRPSVSNTEFEIRYNKQREEFFSYMVDGDTVWADSMSAIKNEIFKYDRNMTSFEWHKIIVIRHPSGFMSDNINSLDFELSRYWASWNTDRPYVQVEDIRDDEPDREPQYLDWAGRIHGGPRIHVISPISLPYRNKSEEMKIIAYSDKSWEMLSAIRENLDRLEADFNSFLSDDNLPEMLMSGNLPQLGA